VEITRSKLAGGGTVDLAGGLAPLATALTCRPQKSRLQNSFGYWLDAVKILPVLCIAPDALGYTGA